MKQTFYSDGALACCGGEEVGLPCSSTPGATGDHDR